MQELPVALASSVVEEARLLITALWESIDFDIKVSEWEDWIHSAEGKGGGFNFNNKGTADGKQGPTWPSERLKPLAFFLNHGKPHNNKS